MSDQDERAAWDQDRRAGDPERLSPAEFARHVFGSRTPIEPEHLRPLGDLVRAGAGVAVRGTIRGRSVVLIALDLGPAVRAWGPPAHPED